MIFFSKLDKKQGRIHGNPVADGWAIAVTKTKTKTKTTQNSKM